MQFQNGVRQVFRRGSGGAAPRLFAARKKEHVVFLIEEVFILFPSSRKERDVFGAERLADDLSDDFGRCGRGRARLDERRISRGQTVDEGKDRELERVVPRPHDERRSVRRRNGIALCGEQVNGRLRADGAHELFQVFAHIPDLCVHHPELCHVAFEIALGKVFSEGAEYFPFVGADRPLKAAQCVYTGGKRQSFS